MRDLGYFRITEIQVYPKMSQTAGKGRLCIYKNLLSICLNNYYTLIIFPHYNIKTYQLQRHLQKSVKNKIIIIYCSVTQGGEKKQYCEYFVMCCLSTLHTFTIEGIFN